MSCNPFNVNAFNIDSAILPPPIKHNFEHNDDVDNNDLVEHLNVFDESFNNFNLDD
jgi:hypothetical protein